MTGIDGIGFGGGRTEGPIAIGAGLPEMGRFRNFDAIDAAVGLPASAATPNQSRTREYIQPLPMPQMPP